jgi:hypothetical protein
LAPRRSARCGTSWKAVTKETLAGVSDDRDGRSSPSRPALDDATCSPPSSRSGGAGGRDRSREPLRTAEYRQLTSRPIEQPGDLPATTDFFARTYGARRASICPRASRGSCSSRSSAKCGRRSASRAGARPPEPPGRVRLRDVPRPRRSRCPAATRSGSPRPRSAAKASSSSSTRRPSRVGELATPVRGAPRSSAAGYDASTVDGTRRRSRASASTCCTRSRTCSSPPSASSAATPRARSASASTAGPRATPSMPMAAILLSTGTDGNEGTLGGLVEQGRRLRRHLQRGVGARPKLCSNDPVCARHSPSEGDLAAPRRRRLPRLPLHRRVLVRALQPLPRSRARRADAGARS